MASQLMQVVFLLLYFLAEDVALSADMNFGRCQVEQLMLDRPELKPLLFKHPEVKAWIETRFAGEGGDRSIGLIRS